MLGRSNFSMSAYTLYLFNLNSKTRQMKGSKLLTDNVKPNYTARIFTFPS